MGSEVAKEELPINKEALTIRVWTSIALLGDFTKMTVQGGHLDLLECL